MGPLPLDNAIISAPLVRNAKFYSPLLLSARQSKPREGPRRPWGPPPEAPCDPIHPLIPQEVQRAPSFIMFKLCGEGEGGLEVLLDSSTFRDQIPESDLHLLFKFCGTDPDSERISRV